MAIKAFICLAALAAIVVGLMMPVPNHHKNEPVRSSIATIDIQN